MQGNTPYHVLGNLGCRVDVSSGNDDWSEQAAGVPAVSEAQQLVRLEHGWHGRADGDEDARRRQTHRRDLRRLQSPGAVPHHSGAVGGRGLVVEGPDLEWVLQHRKAQRPDLCATTDTDTDTDTDRKMDHHDNPHTKKPE